MHEQLHKQLKQITEEEQEILKGQSGVDRSLYTYGKNFVVDKDKMLSRGKLMISARTHGLCSFRNTLSTERCALCCNRENCFF